MVASHREVWPTGIIRRASTVRLGGGLLLGGTPAQMDDPWPMHDPMSVSLPYANDATAQRSNVAKRQDVLTLLQDPAWRQRSDREIARQAGVDHKSVAKWRKQLAGDFPTVAHTVQRGDTSDPLPLPTPSPQSSSQPSRTSVRIAEMLVTQGLSLEAARRVLARLLALAPSERQEAERVLGELLLG